VKILCQEGGTALTKASDNGHAEIVEMLSTHSDSAIDSTNFDDMVSLLMPLICDQNL